MLSLLTYIKKYKKTHLIFDFDETLFKLLLPEERDSHFAEIKDVLINLDQELYLKYIQGNAGWGETQNAFVKKYGKKIVNHIKENNIVFETTKLRGFTINHDLIDFVKSQSQNYEMYIWSSNTKKVIIPILKEFGLGGSFKKIITRDVVNFIKPIPEGFQHINNSKVPLKKYLLIGDSWKDKLAAENIGIDYFEIKFFE